jgi:hypothetical protein
MRRKPYKAFTLVEVAVTIVVVGLIVGTSMTILDNLIGAMSDIRLHTDAFETARQNMESLLSEQNIRDKIEYGISEIHPEIQWQTVIEPFYEPITNAMWIRAICSAGYTDSKGTYQEVELEHWLTNLPANVVRQIIQQQKMEEEYLDLLSGTASGQAEAALQETTIAYLEEEGLNVDAYMSFLERQRRRKLEYIARHGFDDGLKILLSRCVRMRMISSKLSAWIWTSSTTLPGTMYRDRAEQTESAGQAERAEPAERGEQADRAKAYPMAAAIRPSRTVQLRSRAPMTDCPLGKKWKTEIIRNG